MDEATLKLAMSALLMAGAELLKTWQATVSRQGAGRLMERQAFGQRLGVLILGPEDAGVATVQIVLTYGGNVTELAATLEYDLASGSLSVR
jgi:hypothetical protein